MIEVTDEMVRAHRNAPIPHGWRGDELVRSQIAAVLAVVERDYRMAQVCTEELTPGLRCTRTVHTRGAHEGTTSTGNEVRWS